MHLFDPSPSQSAFGRDWFFAGKSDSLVSFRDIAHFFASNYFIHIFIVSSIDVFQSKMSTSPIQFYFWVSWDDFEWTDKNSHLRPNNLTGVRKSQTIKDERGMCECGNFKNPLQTVVLFLLTLVIWSCSVSWLLSSGLLDLSPSYIPETIFTCWLDLLS